MILVLACFALSSVSLIWFLIWFADRRARREVRAIRDYERALFAAQIAMVNRPVAREVPGPQMNRTRLAWLLAAFAAEHPERPLRSVTAIEFALWARKAQQNRVKEASGGWDGKNAECQDKIDGKKSIAEHLQAAE